jgi:hypothetical protein
MTFRKRSKNEGDGGTGVYMREGTTSMVMVVDRPYDGFYDFYSVSPEYFGYALICGNQFFCISGGLSEKRDMKRCVLRACACAIRVAPTGGLP